MIKYFRPPEGEFNKQSLMNVKEAGYKELRDVPKPEYDETTECLSISYKETNEFIETAYTVIPVVESEGENE